MPESKTKLLWMMKYPKPDRKEYKEVVLGKKIPSRVHFIELHIYTEIIRYFIKRWNRKWTEPFFGKGQEITRASSGKLCQVLA